MTARMAWVAAAVQGTLAAGALLAAYLINLNTGIEGAYFSRSVGMPASAAVVDGSVWPQDMLAGAAIALLAGTVVAGVIGIRSGATTFVVRRVAAAVVLAGVATLVAAYLRTRTFDHGAGLVEVFKNAGAINRLGLIHPWIALPAVLAGAAIAWIASGAGMWIAYSRSSK